MKHLPSYRGGAACAFFFAKAEARPQLRRSGVRASHAPFDEQVLPVIFSRSSAANAIFVAVPKSRARRVTGAQQCVQQLCLKARSKPSFKGKNGRLQDTGIARNGS